MKNGTLLAKNQEYVSRKCEKSYFSTKYRISAQNRIRPWGAINTDSCRRNFDYTHSHINDHSQKICLVIVRHETTS